MILLKQFMAWVTASNKISNMDIPELRRRLILVYLVVMATIFGISATSLYIFFARSMRQQLDYELITLAQAAAPSLDIVKEEGIQDLDRELTWQELFSRKKQSLEWFEVDGQTLAKEGKFFPEAPFAKSLLTSTSSKNSFFFQDGDNIRSVTVAVYADEVEKNTLKLKGFIRASESTRMVDSALNQLQLGLWLGGATAMFLVSVSSVYLSHQAFKPTLRSFQQLKQFAADASHELGTPLTKISFATEILLSYPEHLQSSLGQKKLEIISNSTEQMKQLLGDLLFLARTDDTSTLSYSEKSNIRIDQLLQQLAEPLMAAAANKTIDFQLDLNLPLVVKGNASQLNRLFANLLENAFKYTEKGGQVSFSLQESKQSALIIVKDTGIGIAAEHLSHIFQRFWRDERVRKQETEGTGLGLAIAKTIVQQHKGQITVESQVGVGTCFRVYLPLVQTTHNI
ncbi:MAG: HAMP domain-containing sensor histidine kinase [Xenococcus sp. MO_188.B8]|nr:HAMP domain-containing sensor histidine kinase [Xenococcus sp. MO_188.B8]